MIHAKRNSRFAFSPPILLSGGVRPIKGDRAMFRGNEATLNSLFGDAIAAGGAE
jgi:hypothetical protein